MQQWRDAVDNWEATREGNNPYDLPLDGAFFLTFARALFLIHTCMA